MPDRVLHTAADLYAQVETLASRVAMNARHITIGIRPDDDPAERARQVYYRANERAAIAEDILRLFELADWGTLAPGLRAEADALRQEAVRAGDATNGDVTPVKVTEPYRRFIDVELPFDAPAP